MSPVHLKILFINMLLMVICDAEKILVVCPMPLMSHQLFFSGIVKILAQSDHEVTVITTHSVMKQEVINYNVTVVDLTDTIDSYIQEFNENHLKDLVEMQGVEQYEKLLFGLTSHYEQLLKNDKVTKLLNTPTRYDLVIGEACYLQTAAFSHWFNSPFILISSVAPNTLFRYFGLSLHPLYYPDSNYKKNYNFSVKEKIYEIFYAICVEYSEWIHRFKDDSILEKYFEIGMPGLQILSNNVDALLINGNTMFDGNRPVPQALNFVEQHETKRNEIIPMDLLSYLDSSINGVIYMSFGTTFNSTLMPSKAVDVFLRVFSKLPFNVIWKWDSEDMANQPKNVLVRNWLPQAELLKHRNMKLFITQGGSHSLSETLSAGVPVLVFPLFGDQWYNGENIQKHGFGLKLELDTISEDVLEEAIMTVVRDERYRENAVKINELLRDQPIASSFRVLWWTNYVLRHKGATHLRSPATNISWFDYLVVDLILTLFFIFILLMLFLILSVKFIIRKVEKIFTDNTLPRHNKIV